MASYDYGKDECIRAIRQMADTPVGIDPFFNVLDVGACDGKWARLLTAELPDGLMIDAVEVFKPNAARIMGMYRNVFAGNITDYCYRYGQYDLVIFGDVIEHMEVPAAQYVINYAQANAKDVLVGVPFRYKQGELYGNPWERHIQDDLTAELMAERYPMLELLFMAAGDYAYYHAVGGPLAV